MSEVCQTIMLRSGHRNDETKQRVLVYHLISTVLAATIKSASALQQVIKNGFNHENYYVLKRSERNGKYIHIEKDESVILTDFPICFFESEIFEDINNFDQFGDYVLKMYKKSKYYKKGEPVEFVKVSIDELNKVLEMKNVY